MCVYAVAITTNDGEYYEVMNMDQINQCRQVSKASSSPHSPWVKWFDQMAKKTVIHRIAKRLPKNDAISSVVTIDDEPNFQQAVNVTPSEPKDSLSRLRNSIGMEGKDVEQAANDLLEKYNKEAREE